MWPTRGLGSPLLWATSGLGRQVTADLEAVDDTYTDTIGVLTRVRSGSRGGSPLALPTVRSLGKAIDTTWTYTVAALSRIAPLSGVDTSVTDHLTQITRTASLSPTVDTTSHAARAHGGCNDDATVIRLLDPDLFALMYPDLACEPELTLA